MVESAAHLVNHDFPEQAVRQWVLTFPFPLRFLFATQPEALTQVLAVVQRGISSRLAPDFKTIADFRKRATRINYRLITQPRPKAEIQ